MAVLSLAEMKLIFLDRTVSNVTTDAPFSTAEQERYINAAYRDVYEIGGGGVKVVASATAWTTAQTSTTGVVVGILTDIREVLRVWASSTSGSVGVSSGDTELDRAELSLIQWLRKSNLPGTYDRPKCYSVTRVSSTSPASVGLHRLDYWPSVTGFYLPIEYLVNLTILDSTTVTVPDVTDIESADIPLIAAAMAAPTIGRQELVPGILADVSDKTAKALNRKFETMLSGNQDNSAARSS